MTLATSNAVLSWPNYILPQITGAITGAPSLVTPTFSNGSWTLSPSNFTQGKLYSGAQSTDDATASSKFDVDFGEVRGVGLVAAIRHNMSRTPGTATWKIRHGSDAAFASASYDSGFISVMPDTLMYQSGSIPTHWTSTDFDDPPSHEDLAPYVSLASTHIFATQYEARYMRVEFSDTTSPDNYISLGGFFAGPAWQFPYNITEGTIQLGWRDNSTVQKSKSGVRFSDVQPRQRMVTFTVDKMSVDQTMQFPFELAARCGITQPVYFCLEPNSTKHSHRWSFMGYIEEVDAVEFPYALFGKAQFRLVECL